jgi:hypothetical protein
MRKIVLAAILAAVSVTACQTKAKSFRDQLMENFSVHVKQIDSLLLLDSFEITRMDSVSEKVGRTVEDSVYSRELAGLQSQLKDARRGNNKDSIDFLEYEINYMKKEIDSLAALIQKADTTNKFGVIVASSYVLKKDGRSEKDTAYFFMGKKGNILNSDMIDEFIKRSYKRLE